MKKSPSPSPRRAGVERDRFHRAGRHAFPASASTPLYSGRFIEDQRTDNIDRTTVETRSANGDPNDLIGLRDSLENSVLKVLVFTSEQTENLNVKTENGRTG